VLTDARLDNYPQGSELRAAAVRFNEIYADFLDFLTSAYNGQPELLIEAVWRMFRIRDAMLVLIRNPVPGRTGVTAGPTFDVAAAP